MVSPAAQPRVGHRRDIQGLRAIAVLLVIADHAGLRWLSGGFVGVDVFFVISGYLITLLLVREATAAGRVRIGQFYARRARRILPAATVVILATTAYAARELSLTRVQQVRDDALWSAVFAANVHFARLDTDYFQLGREPSPFQHFWSLAVEEQFYLLWPLLLAACLVVAGRRGRRPVTRTRGLTGMLIILVAISLGWSLMQTASAPTIAYYSLPARAWELGVGALLAVTQHRLARLSRWACRLLATAGLAAVATAAVVYDADSALPGWRALLPVLGAAAIVAAGAGAASAGSRLLTVPPLPWLGDLSYSLYLWHWPVLVLGASHAEVFEGTRGTVLLLGVTFVAAVASYYLVENPIRRARLLRPGRRSLVLWPIALAAVVISVVAAERHATALLAQRIDGSTVAPSPSVTTDETPDEPGRRGRQHGTRRRKPPAPPEPSVVDRLSEALRLADAGAPVPFPLTNLTGGTADSWHLHYHCIADSLETSTTVCPIGRRDAKRTILVYGDSQAGEWLPAIERLGQSEGYRVLPVIKYGCSPFDIPMVDGGGADYWQCTAFREWATAYIAGADPDVVILGSQAVPPRMYPAPGLDLEQTWVSGVSTTLDRLRRQGADVVVLADTPDLTFDPVDCLTDPDSTLGSCVGAPHDGLAAANGLTRELADEARAGYLDTVALVCVHGRCPMVVDQTLTFFDVGHVTSSWAAEVADEFTRLFRLAMAPLADGEDPVTRTGAAPPRTPSGP
jgi:peptidoglycan/LPS O-acetylase OafA/YrhL